MAARERTSSPPTYTGLDRVYVGGRWQHGGSDGKIVDRSPYDGETLVEIPKAGVAELDAAYRAARTAQTAWAAALPSERAAVMRNAAAYEDFATRFADRARSLKAGDPDDPDALIGPIINQEQLDGLCERIDEARGLPVRELAGGQPDGLVLPPHVYADVTNDMPIAANELFGPIAPILRAEGEEEALHLANDTVHGLSSCVFTGDAERGSRFARRLEAGMAHVNDHPVHDLPNNPFGGEKSSGIGRFGGEWAVQAFTTDQWVTVQHGART